MNGGAGLVKYLTLRGHVSEFERGYLQRMSRVAAWFFVGNIPTMMVVAALAGTGVLRAAVFTGFFALGPWIALRVLDNPRHVTKVIAVAAMCVAGLLVHFGQGAMQIEMHFYFFVLLALLVMFADPAVIVVAASTIVVHHLLLYFLLPASIFNYEASLWTVVVHALFVLVESVAACFVARTFFDSVIGLEQTVERRTSELEARGAELRLMLDTVDQGFMTLDRRGIVQAERSRALDQWLPPCQPGAALWDYLGAVDAKLGRRLEVGWEALLDDFLPTELLLDQMPKHLTVGAVALEIAYHPLLQEGTLSHVVLVLSDVTAEQQRLRAEEENADLLAVCERIAHDRGGFVEFLAEADQLVAALRDPATDACTKKQRLHTLKGNSALFGLGAVARLCHAYEDAIELGPEAAASAGAALFGRWDQLRAKLTLLFGNHDANGFEITEADYLVLRRALSGTSAAELLEHFKLEPVEPRLLRLGEQARALAQQMGKAPIDVRCNAHGVRLSRGGWGPLWSAFVHLVQNAIDHGGPKTLRLEAAEQGDQVRLSIADDGAGIDWEALRARARACGLAASSHDDLVAALFSSGVSTKQETTRVSGRGVGMSAVAAVVRRMGGSIQVHSEPSHGTLIEVRVPRDQEQRQAFRNSWIAPRSQPGAARVDQLA